MPAVLYTNSHTLWKKIAKASICWVCSIAFVCFLIQSRLLLNNGSVTPTDESFRRDA